MSPHLHKTIGDRYTLTGELRVQPGFSAWLANDSSLSQNCQLFMVSDPSLLPRVNALTSSLVLSNNPYFTPVRQLLREGGESIIVTEIDKGVCIHELLEHGAKFGVEGIRAVVSELCDAASSLLEVSLTHQGICPATVRVFPDGIQIADAPVSCVIRPWPVELSIPEEPLAVKQIANVLFAMVTGEEFVPGTFDALPDAFYGDDSPAEFAVICSRALGLIDERKDESGRKPVEILTLRELKVLLGDPIPFSQLPQDALPPMEEFAAVSITQVPLLPTTEGAARDAHEDERSGSEDRAKQDAAKDNGRMTSWDAGQLLFAGPKAVESVQPADDDTNILAPLDDASTSDQTDDLEPLGDGINSRQTVMLNVGQIRQALKAETEAGEFNGTGDGERGEADGFTQSAGAETATAGNATEETHTGYPEPASRQESDMGVANDQPTQIISINAAPLETPALPERPAASDADHHDDSSSTATDRSIEADDGGQAASGKTIGEQFAEQEFAREEAAAHAALGAQYEPVNGQTANNAGDSAAAQAMDGAQPDTQLNTQPADTYVEPPALPERPTDDAHKGIPSDDPDYGEPIADQDSPAPQDHPDLLEAVQKGPASLSSHTDAGSEQLPSFEERASEPIASAQAAANPAAPVIRPLIDEEDEELPPSFAPTYPPQVNPYDNDFMPEGSDDLDEEADRHTTRRNVIAAIIGILVFLAVLGGGIAAVGMFSGGSGSGTDAPAKDSNTNWPGINEQDVPFPGKQPNGSGSNSSNNALADDAGLDGGVILVDVAGGFSW